VRKCVPGRKKNAVAQSRRRRRSTLGKALLRRFAGELERDGERRREGLERRSAQKVGEKAK
jgi:hypothetical protein